MSVSINGTGSITGIDQGFNVTSGSVGIGTDNPALTAHIFGTAATDVALIESTQNFATLRFKSALNSSGPTIGIDGAGGLQLDQKDTSKYISFAIGSERVRITSAGNVGINDTNPTAKLSVVGNAYVSSDSFMGENAGIFFSGWNDYGAGVYGRNSGNDLVMNAGSSEKVRITSAGNIGINETNPIGDLSITGANGSTMEFQPDIVSGTNRITNFNRSTSTYKAFRLDASQHEFLISGSEKLRITSDGRVCINATSPVQIGGQTPNLYVSYYTNLDGLRIRGLDTGNTIWKTGGDMSLTVDSNDAINLKTNATTRFVLNANSNNSTTLSIGNGSNLTNNTSPDRTSVKVGGTLHLEASFAGQNHRTGMYYNCYASGQNNFYQGTFGANSFDYRAAAATMRGGAFQVYTDPGTSTNYSAGAQITTMKETLTCTNGFVKAPNQPCFWATSNTGGSHTSNGYTGIISNQFEAAYVNVGNHFSTSTGVFTCPVAGTYEFHGQGLIRYQGSAGRAELSFYKNGSNTVTRSYGYTYITGSSDHDNLHVMAYITCAANDQIDLRVYAMDSGIDCYWAQGLGYFAGRLVQ